MAKEPKTLDELFHDTLKDIYFAEKKILATLPKMAKAAQNGELKAAFEKHRDETEVRSSDWTRFSQLSTKSPRARPALPSSVSPRREPKLCRSTRAPPH